MRRPQPPIRAVLAAYDFPGNARELQNVVERGVALSSGGPAGVETVQMLHGTMQLLHRLPRARRADAAGTQQSPENSQAPS